MEMLINEEREEERTMNLIENKPIINYVVIPAIELSKVDVSVRCPESGCGEIFSSRSNLGMHLAKKHGTSAALNKKQGITYYHCPDPECKYAYKRAFFTRATLLKQHFLKVHAAKNHLCEKCHHGFSTAAACNYHSRSCGQGFVCSCGTVYKSNEALLTHAKRKQHRLIKKNPLSTLVDKSKEVMPTSEAVVPVHILAAVALSELSLPNRKEAASALSRPLTREIAVQTEDIDIKLKKKDTVSKTTGCSPNKSRRRTSTQTQTLAPKTSTETQTSGDLLLRKAMLGANIKPTSIEHIQTQTNVKPNKRTHSQTQTLKTNVKKRKHIETQTIKLNKKLNNKIEIIKKSAETQSEMIQNIIEIDKSNELQNELKSANLTEIDTEISLKEFTPSRLIINDVSLPDIWLNQKSTQTSPSEQQVNNNNNLFNAFRNEDTLDKLLTDERFQTSETQTELANFLEDCDTLCSHIETQTCDELNKSFEDMGSQIEGESFEEMLHSNMYTQTCDQLFMDFVDIETQTWDDVSASTSQQ